MNQDVRIAPGQPVTLVFSLSLSDGTVVDAATPEEPLHYVIGDGTLEAGLEQKLLGLTAGASAQFELQPGEAFGLPDEDNIHVLEVDAFPAELELRPGLVIGFTTPAEQEVPGTILDIDQGLVHVDFNHPLAGKTLQFAVKVLSVGAE
ncbi:MAG: FKBP-type peptidyl-prolyl cis-trans isomerase [Gammaproteobacteria bacterium]